ncbi:hypothetical protein LK09_12345 [Microbacterium mangrovi]|uniref:DUF4262 domain-containing protein n=2 Tax=Microbacterium mangrovi TaxID=1348253 RepID=A0A0B2A7R1_9MICO|nr:hypothetical protein LK09_12345 [Microbacterium mangrovi]
MQAWLDQEDAHTAQTIREHGTYIQYVFGDSGRKHTSFAYTVGLFGIGHPELLIVGAGPETSGAVLNDVSDSIRAGSQLIPGQMITFEKWPHRVIAEEVPNPGEIAFAANRFYQRPDEYSVPLLQLTYDDRNGTFPWEPGYAVPGWIQPRPGELRA